MLWLSPEGVRSRVLIDKLDGYELWIYPEQPSTIDPTHVRDMMSKMPTSVTVVAGQPEFTGERAAVIVGSFVFVSLEPCLIGFFVGRKLTSLLRAER